MKMGDRGESKEHGHGDWDDTRIRGFRGLVVIVGSE